MRREPTIDFQTPYTAELGGLKDAKVLAIAAQQGRVLVTHNRKTMPLKFAEFITNNHIAGIIIVSRKLS
ncbi:DUF5615 family PIN-like protein [Tolypothrix sp. FACHB-123]|uniref:DUF5615 family PIN-like protein n=1 Tax=Tolypothrix sp. FACHB-123 TaxID=2692868 RepID=UPI0018F052E4|nr:DUF5615 family PIN-like protein [Tolypothrix sp. FACHB-123]